MKTKSLKESETVELKRSTSEMKEAIIAIVAILNKHQKGELYFGVNNDGTVVGQVIGESTIRDISKAISDHIEPKIYPKINKLSLERKTCIHIEFSGHDILYYAYGQVYMRVGDENKRLSAKEIENIILKKHKEKLRWDTAICEKATLSDISSTKVESFVKKAGLTYDSLENALKKLQLYQDKKLLNTALMLFGKKPQSFFPNAKLRCAVFGTTDTAYPIDMKDFEGDIFYLIEKAEDYILQNIHIGMKVEGLRRIDIPEIDKEAFREAIINAFCHRDYYEYDSVNIAVFKDRVEIRSPGLLYGALTIEKIRTGMVSERRNELIAELFHRVHLIEKWGRGIRLILSKEPTTEFKEVGTHFIVVFHRKEKGTTPRVTPQVTPQVVLTELETKIINEIVKNKKISRSQLAEQLGISQDTIKEYIEKLKKKKMIRRRGRTSSGYWEILQS